MSFDFEKLYKQYKEDYEDLSREYEEYKTTSDAIVAELETQLGESDSQISSLSSQIESLKQKRREQEIEEQKQTSINQREFAKVQQLEDTLSGIRALKVELENENDQLLATNRMLETIVNELEARIDKSIEELAFVQTELEDHMNDSQENIERLKQQLTETEQELFVARHLREEWEKAEEKRRREKNNEGLRMDSNGGSSNGVNSLEERLHSCNYNIQSMRTNNQEFKSSLVLVSSLLQDLDQKMLQIREQRANKAQERRRIRAYQQKKEEVSLPSLAICDQFSMLV